jgi:hypothetical protein
MESHGDRGVVDRSAADGASRVHPAGADRVVAVDDTQVVPVERAEHGELVVDEVVLRVQPLAGLEDHDAHPTLRKLLGEHAARGAAADDAGVDCPFVPAHLAPQVVDADGHGYRRPAPAKSSWRLATAQGEIQA